MTYQNQIASTLAKDAEKNRTQSLHDARSAETVSEVMGAAMLADRARRLDNMAVQFWNGDYDAGLMGKYAALAENPDQATNLSTAADEVTAEMCWEENDDYRHPDDLLGEVVRRALSE